MSGLFGKFLMLNAFTQYRRGFHVGMGVASAYFEEVACVEAQCVPI